MYGFVYSGRLVSTVSRIIGKKLAYICLVLIVYIKIKKM